MSEATSETQWYIAREGQQHGPLTDSEMRAFIEMRHLRTNDLVWRPGFTDWRPATMVFPMQAHGASQGASPTENAPIALLAPSRAVKPQANDQASAKAETGGVDASLGWGKPGSLMAALRRAQQGEAPIAGATRASDHLTDVSVRKPARRAMVAASITGAVLVAGIAIAVLRGGGEADSNATEIAQPAPAEVVTATLAPTPVKAPPPPSGPTQLDSEFQRLPIWTAVKKEFPDWYGERLAEAAKLKAEQQPDLAISKHMAEALVALRRKHADQALSASTDRLRGIATAFLDNLKALSAQSTSACYSFISQGETSPAIVEMLPKREDGRHIHGQVIAIVEAIAEGRAAPVAHQKPNKADYDALAGSLMRLGWSQGDLQLFADPRALARSTPEKVCKMVQDWFVAHITIKDEDAQERLLVETLRPVVSG